MMDMTKLMQAPTPGMSLTNDPDDPKPFEKAPEFTKLQEAQEYLFDSLVDPEKIPVIVQSIRQGIPLSTMAQTILFAGFAKGKWNPDMYLLLLEPCIYILMFISEQAGVQYVLYPDQNMDIGSAGEQQLMANGGVLAQALGINPDKVGSKLPQEIIDKVGSRLFEETASAMPTEEDNSLLGGMNNV